MYDATFRVSVPLVFYFQCFGHFIFCLFPRHSHQRTLFLALFANPSSCAHISPQSRHLSRCRRLHSLICEIESYRCLINAQKSFHEYQKKQNIKRSHSGIQPPLCVLTPAKLRNGCRGLQKVDLLHPSFASALWLPGNLWNQMVNAECQSRSRCRQHQKWSWRVCFVSVVCSSFLTFALSLSLGTATAMTVGIILGYKSARRLRILRRTRAMKTQKIRPGSTQPFHHGSSKAVPMRADDSIQSSRISQVIFFLVIKAQLASKTLFAPPISGKSLFSSTSLLPVPLNGFCYWRSVMKQAVDNTVRHYVRTFRLHNSQLLP